jgi:2-polyprenyl-3-methyl-5-hydroxy-6-metoxy-1,4-benzoquinol methylase
MNNKYCVHRDLALKFEVPFDVKSNRRTRFGSIHQCISCGLNLVHPLPEVAQVSVHYDLPKYYTHGTSHIPEVVPTFLNRAITHLAWRTDRGIGFDPSEVRGSNGSRSKVLDIGCGSGNLLQRFADLGMETYGVDPDNTARLEAEKKGHLAYPGTAEALPSELAGKKFDVVTMTHVLEHCLSPYRALENARTLLAEDGVFYCEVPNAGSTYFQTYGQISEMLDVPRHLYLFRKKDLEVLAKAVGLEITEWKFHGLTRHFSASWKSWENSIFEQLSDAGVKTVCGRRSAIADLMLLTTGIFQSRESRYDCIGFTARAKQSS